MHRGTHTPTHRCTHAYTTETETVRDRQIQSHTHTPSTQTFTLMAVTMANTGRLMRGKHGALWHLKAV